MMANLGRDTIGEMYEKKKDKFKKNHPDEVMIQESIEAMENPQISFSSRFIISEDSYSNMIKNVIVLGFFIVYSIYLPLHVGFNTEIEPLAPIFLTFDILFIFDRFSDLFVEFINKNGIPEPVLWKVMLHNLSFAIFLEIILTAIPILIMPDKGNIDAIMYFMIKFPRIMMLFESTN